MQVLCSTRAVKVLNYLERTVPATVSRSSLADLEKVPSQMLTGALGEVTEDAHLRDWLVTNPLPGPRATVSGPLFQGTVVFARVIFTRPNQPDFAMSPADVQTAVAYATLAVVPIQRYSSQYGYSSVSVSPTVWSARGTLGVAGHLTSRRCRSGDCRQASRVSLPPGNR